jgi:hypothetical protein
MMLRCCCVDLHPNNGGQRWVALMNLSVKAKQGKTVSLEFKV